MRDPATLSPDELRQELERLRRELPPEQYAQASVRIIRQLEKQTPRRYAIT
jgi:5-formyltetrahydrofolate cyclo-ligase